MGLGVSLFAFPLIGTLCASWTCVTFSLIKLGKCSITTFSNRFSIPCCSSSPSGILILWILLCFMCSKTPLTPLCSFTVFFCFVAVWVFFSTVSSSLLIQSSISCNLFLFPFCVLHFLLALTDNFYVLFHSGLVHSKFLAASLEFLEVLTELLQHPYNHYFEFDVW